MTKLWENSSPNTTFAAQDIIISTLSNYDFIFITYGFSISTGYNKSVISNEGAFYLDFAAANANGILVNYHRSALKTNSTTIHFYSGYEVHSSDTETENNGVAIPYAIYGIKQSVTVDVSGVISDVSTSADKCMIDTNTSVEDAIRPAKAYVGVCVGAAYNVITFGCMFPYSVSTATIKVISCLGMPDVEHVDIPCTVAKDAVTGTVAIFATISDTTLMQNIRNYGTVACLEFTYL